MLINSIPVATSLSAINNELHCDTMHSLLESLVAMGMSETEAKIYTAGLSHESITVQELARQTKIKRPTIYHALQRLMEKGLIAERRTGNRSSFSMSPPETMFALLERQREVVDEQMKAFNVILSSLQHKQGSAKGENISIVHYHGKQEMKMVMDIAFYCKSKRWNVIAPFHNFVRDSGPEFAQKYMRARKTHRITSRVLWERVPGARKQTPQEIKERNPRYMPASMHGKFQSMIMLFDDKIAIFSSVETLSAILITSKELHAMFLAMYEAIWDVSKKYE